jgi:peptide/nickel transport system substrate-binding protein
MRRSEAMRVTAVVALLSLIVAACTGTTTTPSGSGATSGSGAPVDTNFTMAMTSEVMVSWDPSDSYSNEVIAMQNMYETLTRYDSETQEVMPLLATSWESNDDGTEWTFTIRDDVIFHSGRAMTSEDVKASIERTMEIGGGAAYIWGAVKSIETPDPTTVTFALEYSSPLDLIASADYAAYIFDTQAAGDQDLAKWFADGNEAGTGPYMLDVWDQGADVELRLKAFPDYWGGWDGTRYQNVIFRVVPEATTAAQLLRSGEVTWVQRLNPQLWQSFQDDPNVTTTTTASWQTLLAMLNTADGPLADQGMRQAVMAAIDYDGMMQALQGGAEPLSGVVPPGLWGHVEDLYPSHDPETATSLLNEAGYGPDGEPMDLELTYVNGDSDEQLVGTLMKSNLADMNVNLDVRGMQWTAQWAKGKSANVEERQDIFLFYWWPDYADPYSWFINLFHTEDPPFFNLSYYSNPAIDSQMEEAEQLAASDRERSTQMFEDMQLTLYDEAPAISLYTQTYQRAMLNTFGGYVDNPAYPNVVFVYGLTPGAA